MHVDTDLLIIGGGSAGCMAAIAARAHAPAVAVTIMEKGGALTRSGSIARGMDGLNIVAQPGKDSPELYVEAARLAAEGICDATPSYVMAAQSYAMLKQLEDWGVRFPRNEQGEYISLQVHPKGKFLVEMDSPDIKLILAQKMTETGAQVLSHTMVISLLMSAGRVSGAMGFNRRTGEFVICSAKATILANGGCARLSLPNSGYLYGTFDFPGNAGDGYAMAYRAGAQLTGFEYTQCMPLIKDVSIPLLYITLTRGAEVINAFGDRIDTEGASTQAMLRELREGRGPIYVKMNHLPEKQIQEIERILFTTERPTQQRFWEGRGIDFRRDMIELGITEYQLCAGHGLAGIVVNKNAETTLDGLYAVGDVACVPRQHLTGAFVFGEIAGRHAAEHLAEIPQPVFDEDIIQTEKQRILSLVDAQETSVTPAQFEYKVRRIIGDYIMPPKNARKLQRGLEWVQHFRKEHKSIRVSDYHELGRLMEIEFILDCAELSAVASMTRTESRWGWYHYRTDFPERDDTNWLVHVILEKGDHPGEVKTSLKPVENTLKPGTGA